MIKDFPGLLGFPRDPNPCEMPWNVHAAKVEGGGGGPESIPGGEGMVCVCERGGGGCFSAILSIKSKAPPSPRPEIPTTPSNNRKVTRPTKRFWVQGSMFFAKFTFAKFFFFF